MNVSSALHQCVLSVPQASPRVPCTVVIPTRRRCPERGSRLHQNPLCQCLDAILVQRSLPRQVVIVSARAKDYTAEALRTYQEAFSSRDVEFKLLWLPDEDRLGPFGKIAKALPTIRHSHVHLIEDDVFLHPDAIAGGYELAHRLRTQHPRLALLNLPVYRRATRPTKFMPCSEIGQLNANLRLTGCFESVFPRELLDDPKGRSYPESKGVLAHRIDFFRGGNNVITKESLQALQAVTLGTPYGWEVCAGLHLRERGFELLHVPYVNLAGMHSFYGGTWGRTRFLGRDWTRDLPSYDGLSLAEIVRSAVKGRQHTGLGPLHLYVYYFRVATCYALILRRYAPEHFVRWLEKLQSCFVERVYSDITAGRQRIADRATRESIFLAALESIIAGEQWFPGASVLSRVAALRRRANGKRHTAICQALRIAASQVTAHAPRPSVGTLGRHTADSTTEEAHA